MFFIIKEIRMAGYDPSGEADTGLTPGDGSNGNPLTITMIADDNGEDDDRDDTVDEDGEIKTIRYDLYVSGGITKLGRRDRPDKEDSSISREPIAEYIDAFNLVYLDEDGNTTTTADDVRSVQVTVIASSENKDQKFTDNRIYKNQQGTVILDKSGDENKDHFRRRMLSYEVKCRNLGL
jgi:hypothetical protein